MDSNNIKSFAQIKEEFGLPDTISSGIYKLDNCLRNMRKLIKSPSAIKRYFVNAQLGKMISSLYHILKSMESRLIVH